LKVYDRSDRCTIRTEQTILDTGERSGMQKMRLAEFFLLASISRHLRLAFMVSMIVQSSIEQFLLVRKEE